MALTDKLPGWAKDIGVTVGGTRYYYQRRGVFFQKKKEE